MIYHYQKDLSHQDANLEIKKLRTRKGKINKDISFKKNISYKNSEESKQDCSNIYAIKKENYQKRVKDFISTTFLIP